MVKKGHIEIITKTGKSFKIDFSDMVNGGVTLSVYRYIDRCVCSFNDNNYNAFRDFENGSEVKVFFWEKARNAEKQIFYGLVDNVRIDFDKTKDMEVVSFVGKGFATVLTNVILKQYEMKYEKGYGEVIKKLVEQFNLFNVDGVLEDMEKGAVYFDKISILEAMRTLAYVKGWCLIFEGKTILFESCKTPKDSGIVITDKDIISGSFTK